MQTARGADLGEEEEQGLVEQQIAKALPRAVQAYKSHPLYALQRHLAKSEAIRPGGMSWAASGWQNMQ